MTICTKCNENKDDSLFGIRYDIRLKDGSRRPKQHSQCKECISNYYKDWKKHNPEAWKEKKRLQRRRARNARKEYVDQLKKGPCKDCGRSYPPVCMDFDHLHDKNFAVSTSEGRDITLEKLHAELAKCDLVCSNCHRIRTHQRLNERRSQ